MIETKRLKIYAASKEQMEACIAAQSDEILKEAYTEMLDGCLTHPDQWEWYAIWMIDLKDGTHVGDLCFKGLSGEGTAEIGYGIEEEHQGHGYATEAVIALVDWAFKQPGVTCITAETEETNIASQNVLIKSGFVPTGETGEEGPLFARRITIRPEEHTMLNKKIRQYIGLIAAALAYYLIHEGAHLITALCMGVFKEVRFLGLGMQVDVAAAQMTDLQMGVFCLAGAVCTLIAAVILTMLATNICRIKNKTVKAVSYYITMVMLLLDPLYLSVLCGFFGGGDMNGISLLLPQAAARIVFAVLFVIGLVVFIKRILPLYKAAFSEDSAVQ